MELINIQFALVVFELNCSPRPDEYQIFGLGEHFVAGGRGSIDFDVGT